MPNKKQKEYFTLRLKLQTDPHQEALLHKRFGVGRKIYNACLRRTLKRYNHLKRSRNYIGKEIHYINPWTFKASQYNHITDSHDKKALSNRWNQIGGNKIQRDLYSAFLIMNSRDDLQETDRQKCIDSFDNFIALHNQEIRRIEKDKDSKLLSSFGIKLQHSAQHRINQNGLICQPQVIVNASLEAWVIKSR